MCENAGPSLGLSQWGAGTSPDLCVFLPNFTFSKWLPEISHSGSVSNTEMSKLHKSGFGSSPTQRERTLWVLWCAVLPAHPWAPLAIALNRQQWCGSHSVNTKLHKQKGERGLWATPEAASLHQRLGDTQSRKEKAAVGCWGGA